MILSRIRLAVFIIVAIGSPSGGAMAGEAAPADLSWIRGANYVPSYARNDVQLWMDYDPTVIDRELGYAQRLKLNCVRVFLQFAVYEKDPARFLERLEGFLGLCAKRGIRMMPVIFDSCFGEFPDLVNYAAKDWMACPGQNRLGPEHWPALEKYAADVVGGHRDDRRIALWDVMNEPTCTRFYQDEKERKRIHDFLDHFLDFVGSLHPSQPRTVGLMSSDEIPLVLEKVDAVGFHNYRPDLRDDIRKVKELAARRGKPVILNEVVRRPEQPFQLAMPILREEGIGWCFWELMLGKTEFSRGMSPIQGVVYPDGTCRDAGEVAAILGIDGEEARKLFPERPRPKIVEDGVTYEGFWTRWTGEGPLRDRLFYSLSPGDTATCSFRGPAVSIIHKVGPDCGIARVLLDGKPAPQAEIDTYSSEVDWNRRTVAASGISGGPHTIAIEVTGRRNEKSSASYVQIVDIEPAPDPLRGSPAPASARWPHGTRSDYERAKDLRKLTENKVFRDRVRASWLPDGRRFWYRVRTGPDAHEFILVDAEKGERRPAFDHGRLAAALAKAGVKDLDAKRLPLERLQWDLEKSQIEFRCGGKGWRLDLKSYDLAEVPRPERPPPARTGRDVPRRSTRTGTETSINFINRTAAEVELFWLDPEGERKSYGKLRPGEERSQHTYEGHVWLAVDGSGKVLLALVAEEEPVTAEITGEGGEKTEAKAEARERRRPDGGSPDGRWKAFIRDQNLWAKNLGTGEEFALSTDGTAEAAYADRLYWSPDSKRLVALRVQKGGDRKVYIIESSPKDQLQPKLHSYDYLKPGDPIPVEKPRLFDVEARKEIPLKDDLFPNPWDIQDIRFRPDGSRFTFVYNQRGHQVLRVLEADASTGAVRAVVDERSPTFIDYAGKQYLHFLDETRELIWMSERDGWNHLYLYDIDSGRVKNQITRGEWVVRGVERVDEKARQVWFRASGIRPEEDPYYIHFCRVNFDGTGLTVLTEGDGTHSVDFSPDRRFIIDTWSRVDHPPVTELRSAEDGRLICEIERADWSDLLETGWSPPERFSAKGRDGTTDIYGVIFRPMNCDRSRKYPVIESIYAGPQDSFVPKSFRPLYQEQSLAELGFIVVKIDGMGTSNRSKKFHDVCWKNLGDSGFPDRILWLRAAAARDPSMDLSRVGIYGGSAGGQSALRALLAHGDFYKVAIADCGCHDNRMDKIWWNELWMGWPVGPEYEEQSNVTQAGKLQGKLLLVVGELDRNVDPSSTLQVANALIKADKDFELLLIPGAGHGSAESPYGQRRRQDFFVRHLLGTEPRSEP